MIPSIFELIDKAQQFWDYLKQQRSRTRQLREQAVVYGTEMAETLASLHNEYPILSREGYMWPIAVWNNFNISRQDPDAILGTLDTEFFSDITLADCQYLEELKQRGYSELFNGTTFVLKNVDISSQIFAINCGLGKYFDAIKTCDSLDAELIGAFTRKKPSSVAELLDVCPKRCAFNKRCPDPAFSGGGRSAAIGISTLIVYQLGGRYFALLRARSLKVATNPGRYHVVPAGMFTAETHNYQKEFSIHHSFYREYQEELFEDHELRRPSGQLSHDWFYSRQQLQYLMGLFDDRLASLYVSGYAINLANYRPEILLLLIIKDSKWTHQQLSLNYEYADTQQLRDNGSEVLLPIDLGTPDSEIVDLIDSVAMGFAPPGIAAFWSGRDLANKVMNQAEPVSSGDSQG